ncbi:MAG TPA: DUF3566 domain-containing protein [Acidimicrobiales bacterium]|nr:DUF3566 domain-containing protein [Acidimicrobiales bacterium]
MAAPQPGKRPPRSKPGAAAPDGPVGGPGGPAGPGRDGSAAPVGPGRDGSAAAPVGPVRPVGPVGPGPVGPAPAWPSAGATDTAETTPPWPVSAQPGGRDGAVGVHSAAASGAAMVGGGVRADGAAPVVPPPPPAPAFPSPPFPSSPEPLPLPPPPPASPLVRRPGWGLYGPSRSGIRREKRPRGPRVVQGKRARRVVRRIDTWTVLKLSFLFYLCVLSVVLIAGIVLWNIAAALGSITSVEKFIRSLFDLTTFKLHPGVILESSVAGGIVLVFLATGANVLAALLYNLISDVVGGVQVIVLEEQETAAPPR